MTSPFRVLYPQSPMENLRGKTLYELYKAQEQNERNIALLTAWLEDEDNFITRENLKEFMRHRKRLNRAIFFRSLKNMVLFSVGR